MNALDVIQRQPWAIRPEALQMILEIASREHIPDMVAAAERLESRRRAIETDAVATKPGTRLDGASTVVMRGSTAVLPIEGPITRYANLFSDISGGTSIEMLARDFQTALASDTVKSIVLHVDSPGGQSSGVGELADILYAARGAKPIWAYVSHMGASAAYWLASATDRIVVAPSSMVGSIGVIASVPDPKRQPGDDFEFVSSQSPNKKPDPSSKEGKGQIQTLVDDLATVFVASVARNRGVSAQTVLDDFGAGDVLVGDKAVQAGLADAIGSFEQVLIDIQVPQIPAVEPPANVQPAKPERRVAGMSTMKDRFDALVALLGGPAAAADTEVGDDAGASLATVIPPPPQMGTTQSTSQAYATIRPVETDGDRHLREELAALKDRNRRLESERINERASAFVERALRVDKRILPVSVDALSAFYAQLAMLDTRMEPVALASGQTTTYVGMLEHFVASLPKSPLTDELLSAGLHTTLVALANQSGTPNGEGLANDKELEALLSATPGGRATLAARRNGGSH